VDIWLVCYDIGSDQRRTRVAAWLLRFGKRVQESVFEVLIKNDAHFDKLWRGLAARIDTSDQIRAYPLHAQILTRVRCLGSEPPNKPDYAVVL
jgi:CRISPR-associated protein Cas2